jgi:hypothetical protein
VVTGIESAGENAWRINIRDRRIGEPQKVEMSFPVSLPLHRQTWLDFVRPPDGQRGLRNPEIL